MSKETFKNFARKHKELADNVIKGNATWQQFYELYEIYGEDNPVWNNYFRETLTDNITSSATTVKDFINTLKNLDMDSVQQGITNIQKTVSLLQDIGFNSKKNNYDTQPIYKRFED